jgi:AAA family ATP:ADP antiporter
VQVVENWTFSLFFCVAELWGAVVISVLFWTLANEVCTVQEAKAIYPLMGIAANVALVAAGNFMKLVNLTLVRVSPFIACLSPSLARLSVC